MLNCLRKQPLYFVKLLCRCVQTSHLNTVSYANHSTKLLVYNPNIRLKYSATNGVKGLRQSKRDKSVIPETEIADDDKIPHDEKFKLENDLDYETVASSAMSVSNVLKTEENVFVIQPYVKWGPKKTTSNPTLQLDEAVSLINSLPNWSVELTLKIPLESFNKRTLFGTGKLDEIVSTIKEFNSNSNRRLSCMFISKSVLPGPQKMFLQQKFNLKVYDRYSIVIQILRLHAKSTEAKLQVAMAEIPYIWAHFRDFDTNTDKRSAIILNDTQKQMLRNRENKLKYELSNIRAHRELLRNKRKQKNFPIIAVVGYTNVGKTCLIKALTGEQKLEPKNKLFATLDVTAHAGILPCHLEVLYMDTVGFMSDIPTGLLECFIATLEDAMLADIIIHVHDISHENYKEQKKHVEETLKSLLHKSDLKDFSETNIINVGNKYDILEEQLQDSITEENKTNDMILISSTKLIGINTLLNEIEGKVLKATNRVKMIIKVPMGGEEASWLYKNAAVTSADADPDNSQQLLLKLVIAESKLQQFKHKFLHKKERM